MKIAQAVYGLGMQPCFETGDLGGDADLVLLFGAAEVLAQPREFERLRSRHPQAILVACSSRVGVCGMQVLKHSLVATAMRFDRTRLHIATMEVRDAGCSGAAGEVLADALPHRDLSHVLAFGDALAMDAAALGSALRAGLPPGVGLAGWLTGSAEDSAPGLVCADRPAARGVLVLLGFYGTGVRVASGPCADACPLAPSRARGAQLAILSGCGRRGAPSKEDMEKEVKIARAMLGERIGLAGFVADTELTVTQTAPRGAEHGGTLSLTAISEFQPEC